MIVFDLETTGLPKAEGSDLDIQPKIIEFGALKLDDETLEEVDRLEFFCNPGHLLDPQIIRMKSLLLLTLNSCVTFSWARSLLLRTTCLLIARY